MLLEPDPFIIVDFVPDSSFSFQKDPDYWGYDELILKTKIPYVDNIKKNLIIATGLRFSLQWRTGKLTGR